MTWGIYILKTWKHDKKALLMLILNSLSNTVIFKSYSASETSGEEQTL